MLIYINFCWQKLNSQSKGIGNKNGFGTSKASAKPARTVLPAVHSARNAAAPKKPQPRPSASARVTKTAVAAWVPSKPPPLEVSADKQLQKRKQILWQAERKEQNARLQKQQEEREREQKMRAERELAKAEQERANFMRRVSHCVVSRLLI